MNAVLVAVLISADLLAYQAVRAGRAGHQWWLAPLGWHDISGFPARQLLIGMLVPVLFLLLLAVLARRSWRYEQVRPPFHGDTEPDTRKITASALPGGLAHPEFWDGEAGVLEDDRPPAITGWFTEQISGLPEAMTAEMRIWFRVMTRGSATPPRRRPRAEVTARIQLRWVLPTLRTWAAAGHQSLREITRADVLAALPPSGNPRSTLGQGLRSVFTILKTEKAIFTNPVAGIATGGHETRYPLPAKISAIRQGLDSPDPACALITALAAFHGLRTGELRHILLTDIRDQRLHLDGRVIPIPLAGPVLTRLNAWLRERSRRWPRTANPHLLINHVTAGSTRPADAGSGSSCRSPSASSARTASCTRSTPPAVMCGGSATCSA